MASNIDTDAWRGASNTPRIYGYINIPTPKYHPWWRAGRESWCIRGIEMGPSDFKKRFVCAYSALIIVSAGFVGLMVYEGIVDEVKVEATILTVGQVGSGAQYNSIQDAINASNPGDTVRVWAGTYIEAPVVNRSISLIGNCTSGNPSTTIDALYTAYGITITANEVNISNLTVIHGTGSGIYVSNVNNCSIINCTLNSNSGAGIYLSYSSENEIENNNCTSNNVGIRLMYSDNNRVDSNNITDTNSGIVQSQSDNNTISNNNLYQDMSIDIQYSTNSTITNNMMINGSITIIGNQLDQWDTHDIDQTNTIGIKPIQYRKNINGGVIPQGSGEVILVNCQNFIVQNQDLRHGGLYLAYSSHNQVMNNILSVEKGKAYLFQSSYNVFRNNNCNNTYYGIELTFSSNNVFENNTLTNHSVGIFTFVSNNNHIRNNTIANNSMYGLQITNSNMNTVNNNNILGNQVGITYVNSISNCIFHNNFIMNSFPPGGLNSITFWNNSVQEGNYWSDYTGLDDGSGGRTANDGIGDTNIPHLGLDNYPLMEPWLFNQSLPKVVYVDDDFNSSIIGWGYNHFNSIQDGINGVVERGTVFVYNGTYSENVVIEKSLNLIGNGSNATFIIGGGSEDTMLILTDWVNVTAFSIINNTWNAGINILDSDQCKIELCNLSNNYEGIYIGFSSNITISNNVCNSNVNSGIGISNSEFTIISNNTCNLHFSHGIGIGSSAIQTIVENNTCNSNYVGM